MASEKTNEYFLQKWKEDYSTLYVIENDGRKSYQIRITSREREELGIVDHYAVLDTNTEGKVYNISYLPFSSHGSTEFYASHYDPIEVQTTGNVCEYDGNLYSKEFSDDDEVTFWECDTHILLLIENPLFNYAGILRYDRDIEERNGKKFIHEISKEVPLFKEWSKEDRAAYLYQFIDSNSESMEEE